MRASGLPLTPLHRMRRLAVPVALAAGLVLLAACGAGDQASQGAAAVPIACDAIQNMDSYRYTVTLNIQSPPPASSAPPPSAAPLSALAGALRNLFSNFTLNGAYIRPDRSQAVLRFQQEELELRTISGRSWLRVGSTWQSESTADLGLMTPLVVCKDIVKQMSSSLSVVQPDVEYVNQVPAQHYRLDETQLRQLPQVLGPKAPRHYVVDVWLAKDGDWPVQVKIASSDVNEKGQPVGLGLTMVIRDIGDKAIQIEPPAAAGEGGGQR